VSEPGATHPVTNGVSSGGGTKRVNHADDLMAGDDERATRRKITLGKMKVSATDAAGEHSQSNLASSGFWDLALNGHEGTRVHWSGR
jgi:hypothetical protein